MLSQGTVLANKVGRRWTHSTLLGINALLFGVVMVIVPYQVPAIRVTILRTKMFFSDQFTEAGVSTVIQVLCMILKMNISATFVVAYIQANSTFWSQFFPQ